MLIRRSTKQDVSMRTRISLAAEQQNSHAILTRSVGVHTTSWQKILLARVATTTKGAFAFPTCTIAVTILGATVGTRARLTEGGLH